MRTHPALTAGATAALLWATPVAAASSEGLAELTPGEACGAQKIDAAARYFRCVARAVNHATARRHDLSEEDVAHCDARFDRAFEKAEATGACRTPGGPSTLREPIEAAVLATARNIDPVTNCSISANDVATCQLSKGTSAVDLAAIVNLLSAFGVTDNTTFWLQAWGGNGGHGNNYPSSGGASGLGVMRRPPRP